MKILISIIISTVLISCSNIRTNNLEEREQSKTQLKRQYSKTFNYKILIGVTGNDKQIYSNGKLVDIKFSEFSNQIAMKSLLSLRWEILQYNSIDKIKVVGELLDDFTSDTNTEKVYYFVLDSWTISVPFKYAIEPSGWMPGDDYLIETKYSLDSSCFTKDIKENYKVFERKE